MRSQFMTKAQVSSRLLLSIRSVDRLLATGKLQAVKLGRAVRISTESVDRFIAGAAEFRAKPEAA
jgi:excisionase family DNA binding protein